jgi:hypothetical protein
VDHPQIYGLQEYFYLPSFVVNFLSEVRMTKNFTRRSRELTFRFLNMFLLVQEFFYQEFL